MFGLWLKFFTETIFRLPILPRTGTLLLELVLDLQPNTHTHKKLAIKV